MGNDDERRDHAVAEERIARILRSNGRDARPYLQRKGLPTSASAGSPSGRARSAIEKPLEPSGSGGFSLLARLSVTKHTALAGWGRK
jgi:hypothetical protein